jgi:hypothetical protein
MTIDAPTTRDAAAGDGSRPHIPRARTGFSFRRFLRRTDR